jgi:hypothetical protein
MEVFWAEAPAQGRGGLPCKLPRSWKIQYREGDDWKDTAVSAGYPVVADRFSRADFAAVTTSSLRLEPQLQDGATAGLTRGTNMDDPAQQQIEPGTGSR